MTLGEAENEDEGKIRASFGRLGWGSGTGCCTDADAIHGGRNKIRKLKLHILLPNRAGGKMMRCLFERKLKKWDARENEKNQLL
jgi:hypothetical protein